MESDESNFTKEERIKARRKQVGKRVRERSQEKKLKADPYLNKDAWRNDEMTRCGHLQGEMSLYRFLETF